MDVVSIDEFIIRRIPPGKPDFDTVVSCGDYDRPTSATLGLRRGEYGLSCSRLAITSPAQLLAQQNCLLADGWRVCIWKVADLPAELEVIVTPSDPPGLDQGHCEIRAKSGFVYNGKLASKLAKKARILKPDEMAD